MGLIITGGLVVILLLVNLLASRKYNSELVKVSKKEYPLKDLIPLGRCIMDVVRYKYQTRYDERLIRKLTQLYPYNETANYLRIHWAHKISFCLFAGLLVNFLGMVSGGEYQIEILIVSVVAMVGLFFLSDADMEKRIQKRDIMISLDFPDFLNKLTLLINAGMTVPRAWEKISTECSKDTPLYIEIRQVLISIRSGKSEYQVYEEFAKRCHTPEITKFISAIIQNLKKGNSELVSILRVQANECWQMRKAAAKKLGEEASSKLLFPMMLMLIAIFLIVLTPAILQMNLG